MLPLFLSLLLACASQEPARRDSSGEALQPQPEDTGYLPLDEGHPGWRDPRCWNSGCHDPADTHHADRAPYQCVPCHDTNGAPASGHSGAAPCADCHGFPHGEEGFPDPASCQTCHP